MLCHISQMDFSRRSSFCVPLQNRLLQHIWELYELVLKDLTSDSCLDKEWKTITLRTWDEVEVKFFSGIVTDESFGKACSRLQILDFGADWHCSSKCQLHVRRFQITVSEVRCKFSNSNICTRVTQCQWRIEHSDRKYPQLSHIHPYILTSWTKREKSTYCLDWDCSQFLYVSVPFWDREHIHDIYWQVLSLHWLRFESEQLKVESHSKCIRNVRVLQ